MLLRSFCILAAGLWAGSALATPPLNLTRAKAAVAEYYESGAYHADVQAVADDAAAWLERRVAAAEPGERLAIVFDIDETVLSNYHQMASQDFGYVPAVWEAWVERGAAAPLKPVRELYRRARELGVAVVFLTGRHEVSEGEGTIKNLRQTGMGEYERLIFRTDADTAPTAAERKAARRAELEAEGYVIMASIGDQHSDLAGGHAERTFKLPNPFYEIH